MAENNKVEKNVSSNKPAKKSLTVRQRRDINQGRAEYFNVFTGILGVIFVVGALSILYQLFVNPTIPNFNLEYFLGFFKEAPAIDLSWMSRVSRSVSDIPGALGNFVNMLWMPASLILWILQGIAQVYIYVGYFLYYFFGFSNFTW